MNKKALRIRALDILAICEGCPKNIKGGNKVKDVLTACGGCALYTELRNIGNVLGANSKDAIEEDKPKRPGPKAKYTMPFSTDDYIEYKRQGLSDPRIAAMHGVTLNGILSWKRQHNLKAKQFKPLKKNTRKMRG